MSHTILITGGSGYLGGSLLAHLRTAQLPEHKKIYALVRTKEQEEAVKQYGVEPLLLNLKDDSSVSKTIIDARITVIFFLIDALSSAMQVTMIKALGQVKKQTGQDVHFLHTTGAKLFSEHAGHPTDQPLLDTDPNLYEIQKSAKPRFPIMGKAVATNTTVIDTAESHGVRSYIFAPCIVYGEGEGFGNVISIQTVAIVRAAKALRRVYNVNPKGSTWPVSHISDNTTLYIQILRKILEDADLGYGKNGYYLASSGSVDWYDIYTTFAKALAKRNVVDDEAVHDADDPVLEKMGKALNRPKEFVVVELGGKCTFQAEHGKQIGWEPQYQPEHILEAADAEVELILKHLKD